MPSIQPPVPPMQAVPGKFAIQPLGTYNHQIKAGQTPLPLLTTPLVYT